jgi:vanillate O-demethylase ferredoxin subunit
MTVAINVLYGQSNNLKILCMSNATNNLKLREVINQVVNDPQYKSVSAVPLISVPQIILLLFTLALIFGSIYLAYIGLSLWIVYPILIFGFYTSFTTLHDATHRALSSNKYLNDFLGTIAGNLQFPFITTTVYRYIHLTHHRYVGDKDLDPDEAMVGIPTKYFPIGYLAVFIYDFLAFSWLVTKAWKRTPINVRRGFIIALIGNVAFNVVMFTSPYWYEYLIWFLIPNRIGVGATSYLFAHLPHPEGVHWHEYPFQATYSLTGNQLTKRALWGQSSHAIHHFLPHVPWYKYYKAWDLANGVFRKQNIPKRDIFSFPDPDFKERVIESGLIDHGDKILNAEVVAVIGVAKNTKSYVFEPVDKEVFPPFTPGAHIHIYLPSGKVRSYSLVNPSYENNRYQIAVKLETNGRGGSKEMHENISVGTTIRISTPKNNFVLYENVQKYILISGGIGITPMISMAHKLTESDKHFEFHICAKEEAFIPFRYELQNWSFAPNVEIHIDKDSKSSIELSKVLAKPDDNTLLYICGPSGFNNWVKQEGLNLGWKTDQIKEELFSMNHTGSTVTRSFEVILHNSGKTISVDKDATIIDALLMNNIKVDYTCLQGTCGTCITPVIEGAIDHRDAILSDAEKMSGNKMCLCVSRAKNDKIVLDL